jgi:hypothetical protein
VAWRKRGRPRLATARRRATTRAGRRSPEDLGSPELIKRKARVANGSAVPVELVDTAGILLAHHLIEPEELLILRLVASWLRQLRVAFGLPAGSPGGLWAAITTGQRGGGWAATLSAISKGGGDRALFRLAELYEHFAELGQLERLALVMQIAAGEARPTNAHALAELRAGLQTVMALQRRGRQRPPVEAAAAQ